MVIAAQERHAVRILLIDEHEAVLLFRAVNPDTGIAFWFPPGGGIEQGESVEQAIRREVAEETGLNDFELGAEIWHRRHVFDWRGTRWDQKERWFVARVNRFEPESTAMTATEMADIVASHWWSVAELYEATENLVPRDLAIQLEDLLRHGPPSTPIEVGL